MDEEAMKNAGFTEPERNCGNCHACTADMIDEESGLPMNAMRFIVCPDCGNKRCPRATDHRNACTGSNDSGQSGSIYVSVPERARDVEMENIRAWWAAMPEEQRRACLMRHNPAACPCGNGAAPGHPCAWCMPHPAWLHPAPAGLDDVAALLDGAVASLTPNCNPRAMPEALGLLRWLAAHLRKVATPDGTITSTALPEPMPADARKREDAAAWCEALASEQERWADWYMTYPAHGTPSVPRLAAARYRLAAGALRGLTVAKQDEKWIRGICEELGVDLCFNPLQRGLRSEPGWRPTLGEYVRGLRNRIAELETFQPALAQEPRAYLVETVWKGVPQEDTRLLDANERTARIVDRYRQETGEVTYRVTPLFAATNEEVGNG